MYHIEYPILCFSGVRPDLQELNVVNLADKTAPVTQLKLENLQLLQFVSYPDTYDQLKICFMAFDFTGEKSKGQAGQVVHC